VFPSLACTTQMITELLQ